MSDNKDSKDTKSTKAVEFKSAHSRGNGHGHVAAGDGRSRAGLVVIQEWWGVNDQIKRKALALAQASGYTCIVPDLYRGETAQNHEHDKAGHLMNGLDWKGAVEDIRGAAVYLRENGCDRVGVIGFCMGGALTIASTVLIEEVDAGAAFYGIPGDGLANPTNNKRPLICHFGTADDLKGFSDLAAQETLKKKLTDSGVPFEFHSYEGLPHAFTNDSRSEVYNAEAAQLATARSLDFFSRQFALNRRVEFKSANSQGNGVGYVCDGDAKANPRFGIVVIQEWWGVNDQIKRKAAALSAESGYATIVPDLYRGRLAKNHEHDKAGHLMNDLDWKGAVEDIRGAVQYLKNTVGCAKVAAIGFCMGGALTLATTILVDEVDAGSCFYGICGDGLANPANNKRPLQCHFGTADNLAGFSNLEAQEGLKKKLAASGTPYEFFQYEGLGHAFTNDSRPEAYNAAGAKLAIGRSLDFFRAQFAPRRS